ncbi:MAG: preprotein translocase subunit SecA, partial [Planctomycetes bacterium]|nr:preprotein translocase subunit SecA [Planctomycetota bacterium]
DVQLIGGMVLHSGSIAEMATGEGKTLAATMPAYLNALGGKVFVVTVNDYLAGRDAEWMKPVFDYLGVQVGAIQSHMRPADRHPVYAGDILYGTNNEFGFDYLRDNMKSRLDDQVQKQLGFAIIDEVDSILIDEARTPLIISGPPTGDAEQYRKGVTYARRLREGLHYELKEKEKSAILTEDGIVEAQKLTGVDDFYSSAEHMEWPHIFEQCLRALHLYTADVDYVVKDGQIIIVDEFTGRLMEGRRWGDGLHQSVEAKEGIRPRAQNQTLATITFQNYFRLFDKLSGMTGTALTEAGEFARIYDLDVVAIPTNRPIAREDVADLVYLTEKDKWLAIAAEIERVHENGQPVLVGTTSIEKSELLSSMLQRRGLKHEVLNAKQHDREAEIVALAGSKGAVTVATNMAGRGTDIKLGGNVDVIVERDSAGKDLSESDMAALQQSVEGQCAADREEVLAAGGLYVLGTERHEARRIDNQLRGRAGRQGDSGYSRFFLSLDDDLMRRFYKDWVKNFLGKAGMGEGEPVESRIVSRAIEKAQKKVEAYHFEIRKNLIEYDEVMNEQRKLIYDQRQDALEANGLNETVRAMFENMIQETTERYAGDGRDVPVDYDALATWAQRKWDWPGQETDLSDLKYEQVPALFLDDALSRLDGREEELGADTMRSLERFLVLNAIDNKWKEHLLTMDSLRAGVGLRSYAQVDPKTEYKREGLEQFKKLLDQVADEVTNFILRVQIKQEDETRLGSAYEGAQASHPAFGGQAQATAAQPQQPPRRQVAVGYSAPSQTHSGNPYAKQQKDMEAASAPMTEAPEQVSKPKVARNAPCPCGSGKKYKQCCGKA